MPTFGFRLEIVKKGSTDVSLQYRHSSDGLLGGLEDANALHLETHMETSTGSARTVGGTCVQFSSDTQLALTTAIGYSELSATKQLLFVVRVSDPKMSTAA